MLYHLIVKFLQDKKKYRKRRAKISADISARLFRVTCNKVSGILIHKDWIVVSRAGPNISYCLTCAHLVNFYPTQWVFTLPGEFYPNPKNVRNTITIANTNIFVGRKILPPLPEFVPPSKNVLIRVIRVNFTFCKILMSPVRFELQNFYPRDKFFWIWQIYY